MPTMDERPARAERNDDAELLELEHEGWQALCTGHDVAADFYAALMHERAVMVTADGVVRSRDDVIRTLRDGGPWDTYAIADPIVVPVAERVRALVYTATARCGDTSFSATITSVYVATPDGWQLALHQQTVAP